jgi:hypothetical protein
MRKQEPKSDAKPLEYTKDGLWMLVLGNMPRDLGFSAEPLPSEPEVLRFRVNGPTTMNHRTGHFDCELHLRRGDDNAAAVKALRCDLVAWAAEDRP